MRAFGWMLSFELDEHQVDTARFLRRLKLSTPAVSLGAVESTICAPAVTSHVKMSAAERKRVGISDNLFRLSVDIEHPEDLMEDLAQALNPR
jgi:cystathionine beta-lyase/cystathionine gamma-synthase